MTKIDLITGFLGSGKTTFLRDYARFLMQQGYHVGIVENDFGAVNVDMLMLQELEGEQCELEAIVGGNDPSDWKRRFKAKLILFALEGIDRVVVEPSGIYDVETFQEILCDETVSTRYEIGSIFTLVDAELDARLSKSAEQLLVSQIMSCGQVVLSKTEGLSGAQISSTVCQLSEMLQAHGCRRDIRTLLFSKDRETRTGEDYQMLMNCGWTDAVSKAPEFDRNELFTSLFFMNQKLRGTELETTIRQLFQDEACGIIFRIKGFFKDEAGNWLEINATKDHLEIAPVKNGQAVVIVIGEHLQKKEIDNYFSEDDRKVISK